MRILEFPKYNDFNEMLWVRILLIWKIFLSLFPKLETKSKDGYWIWMFDTLWFLPVLLVMLEVTGGVGEAAAAAG